LLTVVEILDDEMPELADILVLIESIEEVEIDKLESDGCVVDNTIEDWVLMTKLSSLIVLANENNVDVLIVSVVERVEVEIVLSVLNVFESDKGRLKKDRLVEFEVAELEGRMPEDTLSITRLERLVVEESTLEVELIILDKVKVWLADVGSELYDMVVVVERLDETTVTSSVLVVE
jgi:hypothetical protein